MGGKRPAQEMETHGKGKRKRARPWFPTRLVSGGATFVLAFHAPTDVIFERVILVGPNLSGPNRNPMQSSIRERGKKENGSRSFSFGAKLPEEFGDDGMWKRRRQGEKKKGMSPLREKPKHTLAPEVILWLSSVVVGLIHALCTLGPESQHDHVCFFLSLPSQL